MKRSNYVFVAAAALLLFSAAQFLRSREHPVKAAPAPANAFSSAGWIPLPAASKRSQKRFASAPN